jgi:hypothetical protein
MTKLFKDVVDDLVKALEEQAIANAKVKALAEEAVSKAKANQCQHSSTIIHNEQGEITCLECGELNV